MQPRAGKFTRAHWNRWMADLNGEHPHASALRAGIMEFGEALARSSDHVRKPTT